MASKLTLCVRAGYFAYSPPSLLHPWGMFGGVPRDLAMYRGGKLCSFPPLKSPYKDSLSQLRRGTTPPWQYGTIRMLHTLFFSPRTGALPCTLSRTIRGLTNEPGGYSANLPPLITDVQSTSNLLWTWIPLAPRWVIRPEFKSSRVCSEMDTTCKENKYSDAYTLNIFFSILQSYLFTLGFPKTWA